MLNLMYITNDPAVARIAEAYGVDRIWVDMEFIGKAVRQGGMDTVQLHHTIDDIRAIRAAVSKSEVLVRVNPIHEATADSDTWYTVDGQRLGGHPAKAGLYIHNGEKVLLR